MVPWLWVTLGENTAARRPTVIVLILLRGDATLVGQQESVADVHMPIDFVASRHAAMLYCTMSPHPYTSASTVLDDMTNQNHVKRFLDMDGSEAFCSGPNQ